MFSLRVDTFFAPSDRSWEQPGESLAVACPTPRFASANLPIADGATRYLVELSADAILPADVFVARLPRRRKRRPSLANTLARLPASHI
jgi:hypothetical protein